MLSDAVSEVNQPPPKTWTIGARPDCDVVIDRPTLSGRHCQITVAEGSYWLEDLQSTNGTFVNGVRIETKRRIVPDDRIQLGQEVELDWDLIPGHAAIVIGVGRANGNDVVIDAPAVSSRHCQLTLADDIWLEDVGSTNGTFLHRGDNRVDRVDRVKAELTDAVFLGTYRTSIEALIQPAAERRFEVATWMESRRSTRASTAGTSGLGSKPVWIAVVGTAVLLFVAIGVANWPWSDSSPENGRQQTSRADSEPTPTGAPPQSPVPHVEHPGPDSSVPDDPESRAAAGETRSGAPQPSEISGERANLGSESGIYSVVLTSTDDGLAFQIGSAWAIGRRHLATSAEVIHAIELADSPSSVEVYWGDGRRFKIARCLVHPKYAAAEKTATHAYETYQQIMDQYGDETELSEANQRKVLELNRQFQRANRDMMFYDVALLEVDLRGDSELKNVLDPAPTPVNRIKGRDIMVLGNAYLAEDGLEFDPDTIETLQLPGEFFTSSALRDEPEANGEPVFLLHVQCGDDCVEDLQSRNWMGSPVLDKNNKVVGVFSRLARSLAAGVGENDDESNMFVMPLVDRFQEFD